MDCTSLESIYCNWETPVSYTEEFDSDVLSNCVLYVPSGCKSNYEQVAPWSGFAKIVQAAAVGDTFTDVNGLKYKILSLEDMTVEVVEGSEPTSAELVIPQTVAFESAEYTVVSIGNNAFYSCSTLTSITIPESVTTIGNYAFYACIALTSVSIPEAVTTIGNDAFYACIALPSITIPDAVTTIGDHAFTGCTSLESITIPESVTTIGDYTFRNCSALTSVTIPKSVTTIGNHAFYGCSALTSITIPEAVTTIGNNAFYSCSALTSITIPNSVTTIGEYAFFDCSALTSITIPESVTTIGNYALRICTSLESIYCNWETPVSYTESFSSDVLSNCILYVPSGCKSNYEQVAPWSGFANIVSVAAVGDTFTDSNGLKYKILSLEDMTVEVVNGSQPTSAELVIPQTVTFESSEYTVVSIGNLAFSWCTNLTSIAIPESVTTIGYFAFEYCTTLTSITIPESVTTIGEYALGTCASLESIYCNWETPVSYTEYFSSEVLSNCILYVPSGCKSNYEQVAPWSGFANIVQPVAVGDTFTDSNGLKYKILSLEDMTVEVVEGSEPTSEDLVIPQTVTFESSEYTVVSIGNYALISCKTFTSVMIPETVTSIGNFAFAACSNLISITIPETVTTIGIYAFNICESLTSITIPEAVTTISDGMFANCSSLTSITIPESVTSIGERAFGDCYSLTSITIPNTVTSIGNFAFESCSSLTSVTIPESVTTIGDSAFCGCGALTSITIPESVTTIGDSAFSRCIALASITIPEAVTTIGAMAFTGCPLESIYCNWETPVAYFEMFGSDVLSNCILYVPFGCKSNYEQVEPWSGFANIVSVAAVGDTFTDANGLKYKILSLEDMTVEVVEGSEPTSDELVIPQTVTFESSEYTVVSIGDHAFGGCRTLSSVTIPETVTVIGRAAFDSCYSLASVSIPESVTAIGDYAFNACESLMSITIPESVTTIGEGVFEWCTSLTSITIPETITTIGGWAFYGCSGLTSITIPESVTTIGNYAFGRCTSLESIYCNWETPVAYTENFSSEVLSNCILYVPSGCKSNYEQVEPWSGFANIVERDYSSMGSVAIDGIPTVRIENGSLIIDGIDDNVGVMIFDIAGRTIYQGYGMSVVNIVNGVYIVKVGNYTTKIRF